MSMSRNDSDELPPLDDFIDSDTDVQLNGLDEDSDEFDAMALLSQPIFADSDGDLDIGKGSDDFDSIDSLPHVPDEDTSSMGPSNFPQSQQPQSSGFDSYVGHPQSMAGAGQGNFQGSSGGARIASPSGENNNINNDLRLELQNVDYQVQDVQRTILQVQQRIEQVQLGTSNIRDGNFVSPQQKQSLSIQDQIDIQALMSQAGMNRSPPGRSISMPIRRNQMQGGPMNQPAFMMQKPMDQLLEQSTVMGNARESSGLSHFNNNNNNNINNNNNNNMEGSSMNMAQLQQQQAMMGNSQGSSGSARSNPTATGGGINMNQLQMMMNKNSIDGPLNSPGGNSLGMMQKSLIERQRGVMSSPDSQYSHHSPSRSMQQGMNRMQGSMMQGIHQPFTVDESERSTMGNVQMVTNLQGMNQGYAMDNAEPNMMNNISMMNNMNNMQGFNQSFIGGNSDRNTMNNMQRFNNLDGSVGSMPSDMSGMGMNSNMMMMMQQQQMVNFRDGGAAQRQNSLSSNSSSHLAMMSNRSQEMMVPCADFELAQMQRSFQAQQMSLSQAPTSGLSMERLVEKMQRSAVSRNLVKQMSGSSVPLNTTGRSVSRSHSGRGVARTNSKTGRTVSRANSGRAVQRTSSGRQLEGGELPVRRLAQDSKHRIKDPGLSNSVHRGVVRHKSQSAAMGSSNSKVVNIDGKEVGLF